MTSGAEKSVDLVYRGRFDLPGPLAHGVITKSGTAHLVGHGRANHADQRALSDPHQNNTDGNARFYGFECENLDDGRDPWPEANSTPSSAYRQHSAATTDGTPHP